MSNPAKRSPLLLLVLAAAVFSRPGNALDQTKAKPEISGALLIQWTAEDRFIFVPDPASPLRLRTSRNREITPGRMYTDGGSIPRVFWSVRGFSPWGYGPAYVVHDWLFHQHRCKLDMPPNKLSMAEANEALDEAIGVLMAKKKVTDNQRARSLIKWAVDNFAMAAWNEPCDEVPPSPSPGALPAGPAPITVGRISFSD
jgi:Protein of unknown function (DUF1353)